MIEVIAEHSIDTAILRKEGNILDLGCRFFSFTKYFDNLGHFVVPVDCDALKGDRPYLRFAITNYCGVANIKRTADPQATSISKIITGEDVACLTLEKLSEYCKVPFWDIIKMDVEGSEQEIIMNLEKAPAKQLSIEFHLHTGVYGIVQAKLMEAKLKTLGYQAVQHVMEKRHGAGVNYWDSLFILR